MLTNVYHFLRSLMFLFFWNVFYIYRINICYKAHESSHGEVSSVVLNTHPDTCVTDRQTDTTLQHKHDH